MDELILKYYKLNLLDFNYNFYSFFGGGVHYSFLHLSILLLSFIFLRMWTLSLSNFFRKDISRLNQLFSDP